MPIEEPIHKLTQSRISFLKNYILSALLIIFIAYLFLVNFPVSQIGALASAALVIIFVIHPEIERLRSTYVITSSQIIIEEGIIGRKRRSLFFNNSSDISVHQNFLQRVLRYGSVVIGSSSGRDHMELNLKGVRKPKELAYSIERLIKQYGNEKHERKENSEMMKKETD